MKIKELSAAKKEVQNKDIAIENVQSELQMSLENVLILEGNLKWAEDALSTKDEEECHASESVVKISELISVNSTLEDVIEYLYDLFGVKAEICSKTGKRLHGIDIDKFDASIRKAKTLLNTNYPSHTQIKINSMVEHKNWLIKFKRKPNTKSKKEAHHERHHGWPTSLCGSNLLNYLYDAPHHNHTFAHVHIALFARSKKMNTAAMLMLHKHMDFNTYV